MEINEINKINEMNEEAYIRINFISRRVQE
jgi:hypothetical protein